VAAFVLYAAIYQSKTRSLFSAPAIVAVTLLLAARQLRLAGSRANRVRVGALAGSGAAPGGGAGPLSGLGAASESAAGWGDKPPKAAGRGAPPAGAGLRPEPAASGGARPPPRGTPAPAGSRATARRELESPPPRLAASLSSGAPDSPVQGRVLEPGWPRTLVYAAVVALAAGELTWALNYWPLNGLLGGAFLMSAFYFLVGILSHHLQARLTHRLVIEYGMVAAAGTLLIAAAGLLRRAA
jgi:hypothetical protein